jgi:hypothetical protein
MGLACIFGDRPSNHDVDHGSCHTQLPMVIMSNARPARKYDGIEDVNNTKRHVSFRVCLRLQQERVLMCGRCRMLHSRLLYFPFRRLHAPVAPVEGLKAALALQVSTREDFHFLPRCSLACNIRSSTPNLTRPSTPLGLPQIAILRLRCRGIHFCSRCDSTGTAGGTLTSSNPDPCYDQHPIPQSWSAIINPGYTSRRDA